MHFREPDTPEALRRGLRLLIGRSDLHPDEVELQVDGLLHQADRCRLSLQHLLVASDGDGDQAACLCVDAPGRTSSLFLPPLEQSSHPFDSLVSLVTRVTELADSRGVRLLQAMLPPKHPRETDVLRAAGFEWLARLLLLERDLASPLPRAARLPEVRWVDYAAETHALFADVVEGTYAGSLDCAALTGLRRIDDILESHRSTGQFLPELWQVVMVEDAPAGALLLGDMPDQWACEVVYVGLLPPFRGRGLGDMLIRRAVSLARDRGAGKLILSVDERNQPARRMYTRFGFDEVGRREAWIRILGCVDG